jgi:hypothetical protein
MVSSGRSILAFGVGFVSGWAARSLADTPEGVGVKLLEIGITAKDRVGAWARLEGERLEDMLAEARSRVSEESSETDGVTNGSGHRASTKAERA